MLPWILRYTLQPVHCIIVTYTHHTPSAQSPRYGLDPRRLYVGTAPWWVGSLTGFTNPVRPFVVRTWCSDPTVTLGKLPLELRGCPNCV